MRYAFLTISLCLVLFGFAPSAHATVYYVDFKAAAHGNGLATTTPFTSLDAFTEVARNAGDIAFVRRNTASTTNVSDLNFTSDGTIANPIIISADNDNLWNDASTTAQTYTVAIATSTFTASAAITAVSAGDWFYVEGDCTQTYNSTSLNQCEYFYEVAWISGTQLGLYMPYKGDQSGSGLALINLGKNPQWNTATGDFQWNFDTDNDWLIKGLDIRGTDANGQIEIDSSDDISVFDSIFAGNGANDWSFGWSDDLVSLVLRKVRVATNAALVALFADSYGVLDAKGLYITGNGNTQLFTGNSTGNFVVANISEGLFTALGAQPLDYNTAAGVAGTGITTLSNIKLPGVSYLNGSEASYGFGTFVSDLNTVGTNFTSWGTNIEQANIPAIQSTTTVVRSGGGPISIQVTPGTSVNNRTSLNLIKLFEYGIYANTSSKQYDMYFMSSSTNAWTTDPKSSELWVECEYWAHDTNATSTRKIKKSTGTADFNGSTSWQNLSVTCQPSQTGILYLRGWYGKAKESGKMNEFFVDGTPVIQ